MRRSERPPCSVCGKRPAIFKPAFGRIKWDRDHDMCMRCFRSQMDRMQNQRPKNHPSPAQMRRIYARQ